MTGPLVFFGLVDALLMAQAGAVLWAIRRARAATTICDVSKGDAASPDRMIITPGMLSDAEVAKLRADWEHLQAGPLSQVALVCIGTRGWLAESAPCTAHARPIFFGRIQSLRGKQGKNSRHPRCRDLDLQRSSKP